MENVHDIAKGTAKSLRKAARGVERIAAILADEPDAEEYRGPFKTVVGMVAECLPDDPQFVADLAQKIADANDYHDDGTPGVLTLTMTRRTPPPMS